MEPQGTVKERSEDARSRLENVAFGVVPVAFEGADGEITRVTRDRRWLSAELVRLNAPSGE